MRQPLLVIAPIRDRLAKKPHARGEYFPGTEWRAAKTIREKPVQDGEEISVIKSAPFEGAPDYIQEGEWRRLHPDGQQYRPASVHKV